MFVYILSVTIFLLILIITIYALNYAIHLPSEKLKTAKLVFTQLFVHKYCNITKIQSSYSTLKKLISDINIIYPSYKIYYILIIYDKVI